MGVRRGEGSVRPSALTPRRLRVSKEEAAVRGEGARCGEQPVGSHGQQGSRRPRTSPERVHLEYLPGKAVCHVCGSWT